MTTAHDRAIAIITQVVFWMLFATWAMAQEPIVVAPVPSAGVSPALQWVMGLASTLVGIFVPLLVIWLKQYLSVQSDKARAEMINSSIVRGAHLADADMTQRHQTAADLTPDSPIMRQAVAYVGAAYPDAIAATDQATDSHITQAITAELNKIQITKAATTQPSVILAPVSAIR